MLVTKLNGGDRIGCIGYTASQGYTYIDLMDSKHSGNASVYQGPNGGFLLKGYTTGWGACVTAGMHTPLWWSNGTAGGIDTVGGGATFTGLSGISALYEDNAYVWTVAGSGIYRCSTNSGCASPPPAWATGQSNPMFIVSDGVNAYWTNQGSGEIMRCAVSLGTCAAPTPLAQGLMTPTGITEDSGAVYFTAAGGVYRVAK